MTPWYWISLLETMDRDYSDTTLVYASGIQLE